MQKDINLNEVVQPALQVVEFILRKVNLGDSSLAKRTEVKVENGDVVVLMPDYAKYADKGRRPGKIPPVSSILEWIRRENIAVPTSFTQEQFAFAIAKNIGKEGTRGHFFIEQMASNLQELVFDYINKEIDKLIKNI